MNKDRMVINEGIISHIERLGKVYVSMIAPQMGQQAPSTYHADGLTEAMKKLAGEIKVEPAQEGEI